MPILRPHDTRAPPLLLLGFEVVPGNIMPATLGAHLLGLAWLLNRMRRKLGDQADRQKIVTLVSRAAVEAEDGEAFWRLLVRYRLPESRRYGGLALGARCTRPQAPGDRHTLPDTHAARHTRCPTHTRCPVPWGLTRNSVTIPGMPYLRIANIRVDVTEPESLLPGRVANQLGLREADVSAWRILRKSLDARSRYDLTFVYTILVELPEGDLIPRLLARQPADVQLYAPPRFEDPEPGGRPLDQRPVVIGSGPAGLLAAYFLAWKGYRPLIIERGQPVKLRVPAIRAFEAGGDHDAENNYLFGEGGAGTFSDGKLTCRLSGPDVTWVLERLVECGGKPALIYEHRPHLGSNRLPLIVRNLRRKIEALGGEYWFGCRLEGLDVAAGGLRGLHTSRGYLAATRAILGIGHSARDTYAMLLAAGIPLQPKAFQLGLRIEQPQEQINRHKYGRPEYLELLGAADYTLTAHGQRDVYSFCMCAGGVTIPSVSEPECLATNGMSNSRHDTPFANSGIMVTLEPHEFGGTHALAGVDLQRRFEQLAFALAGRNYRAPIQTAADFLAGRTPPPGQRLDSSYQRGTTALNLDQVLPPLVSAAIRAGLPVMDRKWRGDFLRNANLLGPEMRGSSPVRIERDASTRQSPGCPGLYPVGEGAGFAGGIISAAVDGLLSAKQIVRQFAPNG